MRIPVLAVAAAMLLGAPAARAEWLLAAFATRVVAGQPLNISIVRDASDELPLPDRLEAVIEVGEQRVAVELLAAGGGEGAAFRRDYVLNWPEQITGAAVVELADRGSSRLLLIAQEAAAPPGADVAKAAHEPVLPAAALPPAPALSVNEPMYFLIGGGAGRSARVQLSIDLTSEFSVVSKSISNATVGSTGRSTIARRRLPFGSMFDSLKLSMAAL